MEVLRREPTPNPAGKGKEFSIGDIVFITNPRLDNISIKGKKLKIQRLEGVVEGMLAASFVDKADVKRYSGKYFFFKPEELEAKPTPNPATKEPWQMTKAEYETAYGKSKRSTTLTGGFSPHKEYVAVAVNQGKPVPPEVLKDYPDLKPTPPKGIEGVLTKEYLSKKEAIGVLKERINSIKTETKDKRDLRLSLQQRERELEQLDRRLLGKGIDASKIVTPTPKPAEKPTPPKGIEPAGILTLKEMTPEQIVRYNTDLKKWQDKGLSKWEAVKAARRTVTYNYDLKPTPFIEASTKLAQDQRGAPEQAMDRIQHSQIAQLYGFAAEHVGDITNRMAEDVTFFKGNFAAVEEKVRKTLRILRDKVGFEKEFMQQIESNLPFLRERGKPSFATVDEGLARLKELGQAYADEHKKLVVANEAQRIARDAAVSIGEFRFKDAIKNLEILETELTKGREAWDAFALHGIEVQPNPTNPSSGNPVGTCYPDSWRYVMRNIEGVLVHGTIVGLRGRMSHAWVELPDGTVWDPSAQATMPIEKYYALVDPIVEDRYTADEAAHMLSVGKHGPWTEEEKQRILGGNPMAKTASERLSFHEIIFGKGSVPPLTTLKRGMAVNKMLPMPPEQGPPLPRALGLHWPWK